MFAVPYFNDLTASFSSIRIPTIHINTDDIVERIKEIACKAFEVFSSFFNSSENVPAESSTKSFAFITAVSLIILLFLSAVRKRGPNILPPPTPFPQNSTHSK